MTEPKLTEPKLTEPKLTEPKLAEHEGTEPASDAALPRVRRHRRPARRDGMKLLRVWVPDPSAPGFRAEAARQAALLKGAAEEIEALRFIEAAFAWPEP